MTAEVYSRSQVGRCLEKSEKPETETTRFLCALTILEPSNEGVLKTEKHGVYRFSKEPSTELQRCFRMLSVYLSWGIPMTCFQLQYGCLGFIVVHENSGVTFSHHPWTMRKPALYGFMNRDSNTKRFLYGWRYFFHEQIWKVIHFLRYPEDFIAIPPTRLHEEFSSAEGAETLLKSIDLHGSRIEVVSSKQPNLLRCSGLHESFQVFLGMCLNKIEGEVPSFEGVL